MIKFTAPHFLIKVVAFMFISNAVFAQNLILQLTPSSHNGYNISCFGGRDGAIDLTVYNGVAPFIIQWSNDATTEDIIGLPEGYYRVVVWDAIGKSEEAEITLTQPDPFQPGISLWKYTHPNGYNTSCHFCFDGIITLSTESGISPFTYQWSDGAITADRTNINEGVYEITVSDANGCTARSSISITAPGRDDWTMKGNIGSNPSTDFLGTSDNKDFSFRTNNVERLRILNTGDIKMPGLNTGSGMLYIDGNGVVKNSFSSSPCAVFGNTWSASSGNLLYTCPSLNVSVGNLSPPTGVKFAVAGSSYFDGNTGIGISGLNNIKLGVNGLVSIGSTTFLNQMDVASLAGYSLIADGKIGVREVRVRATGAWPDYVFDESYELKTMEELALYFKQHKHLPGIPSADEIHNEQGFDLAKMQQLQLEKIEELYLYILQLENRVKELERK